MRFFCGYSTIAAAAIFIVVRIVFCCRSGRTFVALALNVMDRCSFDEKQTSLICSCCLFVFGLLYVSEKGVQFPNFQNNHKRERARVRKEDPYVCDLIL